MHRPSAACCFCCWVYSGWTNFFLKLYNADCLSILPSLADDSVDLILTDPPYGTTACKWDSIIPFEPMWKELKRIIKDNGCIALFAQDKFTANLIYSNIKDHKYNLIWNKVLTSGFLNANRMPLRSHEDIVVFYNKQPVYNPQKKIASIDNVTHSRGKGFIKNINTYNKYKTATTKIDNLKYPKSVLEFKTIHPSKKIHPTQKPVALLEYLIKTYTNENDTVLDFTMGSGSTGVAAKNLNREFIGIELDKKYFEIASNRINENSNSVYTS